MRPGDRGSSGNAVDGGAEGAGHVHPGSLIVGCSPARAPGEPGCPPQLVDQRQALAVGVLGGCAVAGAVGNGELIVQLADPPTIGIPGGGVHKGPGVRGGQPGPAGRQV